LNLLRLGGDFDLRLGGQFWGWGSVVVTQA
jgi:hypothetical protein